MARKPMTFADRAKQLKARYSRADFDPIERKELNAELQKLREQQEAARAQMGIQPDQQQEQPEMPQQAYGGRYDGYNGSQYLDPNNLTYYRNLMPNKISDQPYEYNFYGNDNKVPSAQSKPISTPASISRVSAPTMAAKDWGNGTIGLNNTYGNSLADDIYQPNRSGGSNDWTFNNFGVKGDLSKTASSPNQPQPISTSMAPFLVSAGASAIGDIASMINSRNMYKPVSLPRMGVNTVNYTPYREALQRQFNTNRNAMLRAGRDQGGASMYPNQIAGLSSLQDSYGNQMGQSYMTEANQNAQIRNEANRTNADIGAREAMENAQLRNQRGAMQNQYIQDLASTVPSALRDYRQQVNQDRELGVMGKDYGLYQLPIPQNETWAQRFKRNMTYNPWGVYSREYINSRQ